MVYFLIILRFFFFLSLSLHLPPFLKTPLKCHLHLLTALPPSFRPQQPGKTPDSGNSLVKSTLYFFLFPTLSENHTLSKPLFFFLFSSLSSFRFFSSKRPSSFLFLCLQTLIRLLIPLHFLSFPLRLPIQLHFS